MNTLPSTNMLDNVLDMLVNTLEASDEDPENATSLLDYSWSLFSDGKITASQFVKLIEVADGLTVHNSLLIEAAELALSHEAVEIARQLVHRGQRLYSDNEKIQQLAAVLQAPKLLNASRPARTDLASSMQWLRDHSADYAGQWVALDNGALLGTGISRKSLVEQLGNDVDTTKILITRIP